MNKDLLNAYSPKEEKLNVMTHLLGLLFSVIGCILLIYKSIAVGSGNMIFSFSIFGLSMITLYLASTLYHNSKTEQKRIHLKIFDHVSIYLLIAGTYTPYTLITLKNEQGLWVFSIVWLFALVGIILKLFFTGKFNIISTLMYVLMGWMIVFSFEDLKHNISIDGINWLIAGGIAYTIGAILYSIKKIPFNHAIFHCFVLIGTICHYISIYCYVN